LAGPPPSGRAFLGLRMTVGDEPEERKAPLAREIFEKPPGDGQIEEVESACLEPHIQEQLGRVFRSFCDDLIQQPIPDKFVVLLARLEARQREKK
jgi:hypothetical protein